MDPIPFARAEVTDIAHAIQLSVGPVFLLSGIGVFLNVLTQRLSRVVDRARPLEEKFKSASAEEAADLRQRLAVMARRSRHINRAITSSTLAALFVSLVVNPANRKAPLLLSALYFRSGNRAAAEGTLRKAIAFDPQNPFYRMALGRVLKGSGRFEDALVEFRKVERMRPNNPQLLFEMGVMHRATGNCRQAVGYLKRFLTVTHQSTQLRVIRIRDEAARISRTAAGNPGENRAATGLLAAIGPGGMMSPSIRHEPE